MADPQLTPSSHDRATTDDVPSPERVVELLREAYATRNSDIGPEEFLKTLLEGVVIWADLELVEARMIVSHLRNDGETDDLSPAGAIKTDSMQSIINRLCSLSMEDGLTGLFNRRYLHHRLRQEIQGVTREQRACSLVMADIDLFKGVNDAYGHDVGDLALKHVARILVEHFRDTDVVTRFGGEEFAIVLPGTSLKEAVRAAERARKAVESEAVKTNLGDVPLTISFGVATCRPNAPFSVEQIIKHADTALYAAKNVGRNNVKFFGVIPSGETASAVSEEEKEELLR